MSKILVTGANGFVGKELCSTLQGRGLDFVAAVRHCLDGEQVAIGDLTAATDWANALAGCDSVIHLAARVHVMNDRSSDPLVVFRKINVDATLNLARQAVASGVKRFVFVSSIKVNGEQTTDKPFSVFDTPAPADPYGQSKFEAEQALLELSQETGLEVVIVRPPLIYGPGVRANFQNLMGLVKSGVPLPLGAIPNRRSMVALYNFIDLLIVCVRHPNAGGQTFMVSDGMDVSVSELLRMLARSMGTRTLLLPIPAGLIARTASLFGKSAMANRLLGSLQVDIDHTMLALDWRPIIGMQEAIDKTVAYFLIHR
jgi:nucleoside-diphosphate-sugar epimerase